MNSSSFYDGNSGTLSSYTDEILSPF